MDTGTDMEMIMDTDIAYVHVQLEWIDFNFFLPAQTWSDSSISLAKCSKISAVLSFEKLEFLLTHILICFTSN